MDLKLGTVGITKHKKTDRAVTDTVTASVSLTPAPVTVPNGGTVQLVGTARNATGQLLTGKTYAYSSTAPTKATVNASTGLVSAVAPGTTNITVLCDGVTSNICTVTVV